MTPHVELVYFEGCPHAEEARNRLREALALLQLPPAWTEWDTERVHTPSTYRRFASPTVLVDGVDVSGGVEGAGMGCAVGGGPTAEVIVRALRSVGA